MVDVIVALIVGIGSIISVIITNAASNNKTHNKYETYIEVTNEKIDNLTKEVRKHNQFADRIQSADTQIQILMTRIEVLEREIKELKNAKKN